MQVSPWILQKFPALEVLCFLPNEPGWGDEGAVAKTICQEFQVFCPRLHEVIDGTGAVWKMRSDEGWLKQVQWARWIDVRSVMGDWE